MTINESTPDWIRRAYIYDVGGTGLEGGVKMTPKMLATEGSVLQVLHDGRTVVNGASGNGLSHALPIIDDASRRHQPGSTGLLHGSGMYSKQ